ncbi:MAG: 3-hydroxyacyl-(acyl-carrier-protein) dehydratase FabZ [Candidatus Omnitrophica bacterium ADurb.Bin277]|nr:MAG: 3-hydroxyacyl-(acyl-carrier-protein) dehydratase FabZ [Candidatus Omnitrophica bacterium ADurb.Bin277]
MSVLSVEKVLWMKEGEGITAFGRIPKDSEFFHDHFPEFPVLPGVLALEMLKQTAEKYLEALSGQSGKADTRYFLKQIRATRFTKYLRPGDEWESRLMLIRGSPEETVWDAKLYYHGEVAVSAKLTLAKIKDPQSSAVSS